MRWLLTAMLVMPAMPASAVCPGPVSEAVYGAVDISGVGTTPSVRSNGSAYYTDCWGNMGGNVGLMVTHSIMETADFEDVNVKYESLTVPSGVWSGDNIAYDGGTFGDCFYGVVWAGVDRLFYNVQNEFASSAYCVPDLPDPPLPDPGPQCTHDETSPCSPIVINFGLGTYKLTGAGSPVLFDISATGRPVSIGWTAPDADESFLWLDRNGNGKVDNGAELFGSSTPLKNGRKATNGFEALKEVDDNHDDIIDSRDAIWSQLQLWRDSNHNGISEPNEITPVVGSRLIAIATPYTWTGLRDSSGNMFRYVSLVWLRTSGFPSFPRTVFDIFFVAVP